MCFRRYQRLSLYYENLKIELVEKLYENWIFPRLMEIDYVVFP